MKKSFKLAALFVAAAISVAVVSCNKDKETEEPVASHEKRIHTAYVTYAYAVEVTEQ